MFATWADCEVHVFGSENMRRQELKDVQCLVCIAVKYWVQFR